MNGVMKQINKIVYVKLREWEKIDGDGERGVRENSLTRTQEKEIKIIFNLCDDEQKQKFTVQISSIQ